MQFTNSVNIRTTYLVLMCIKKLMLNQKVTFPVLLIQRSNFTRLHELTSLGFFTSHICVLDDKHFGISVLIFHFNVHTYNLPCSEMCHMKLMKSHKVTFLQMMSSVMVDHQSKFILHFQDTKDYVMLNTYNFFLVLLQLA